MSKKEDNVVLIAKDDVKLNNFVSPENMTSYRYSHTEHRRYSSKIDDLEKNALSFICDRLQMKRETEKGFEFNRDQLCLYNSIHSFFESGTKKDAFDIYYWVIQKEMGFDKDSEEESKTDNNNKERKAKKIVEARKMIEMLSDYEGNASQLVMSHRDHYSHSVYVFLTGLAIYNSSSSFREAYKDKYYNGKDINDKELAEDFLKFWSITSLFHDIGYVYEIPFEQIKSYTNNMGKGRDELNDKTFLSYKQVEYWSDIRNRDEIKSRLKNSVTKSKTEEQISKLGIYDDGIEYSLDRIFANNIFRILVDENKNRETVKDRNLNRHELIKKLNHKATEPEVASSQDGSSEKNVESIFMDHAYFSAMILFDKLIAADFDSFFGDDLYKYMDSLTAVEMHNSLFKYAISNKKPLRMNEHPLAFLLMLCDELQIWNRTSYGVNSKSEEHSLGCEMLFDGDRILACYQYNKEFENKKLSKSLEKFYTVKPDKRMNIDKCLFGPEENLDKDEKKINAWERLIDTISATRANLMGYRAINKLEIGSAVENGNGLSCNYGKDPDTKKTIIKKPSFEDLSADINAQNKVFVTKKLKSATVNFMDFAALDKYWSISKKYFYIFDDMADSCKTWKMIDGITDQNDKPEFLNELAAFLNERATKGFNDSPELIWYLLQKNYFQNVVFLSDIEEIVSINNYAKKEENSEKGGLQLDVCCCYADDDKYRDDGISNSSIMNIFDLAVNLYSNFRHKNNLEKDKLTCEFENEPLYYKLSFINRAKSIGRYLSNINCFYTDSVCGLHRMSNKEAFSTDETRAITLMERARLKKEQEGLLRDNPVLENFERSFYDKTQKAKGSYRQANLYVKQTQYASKRLSGEDNGGNTVDVIINAVNSIPGMSIYRLNKSPEYVLLMEEVPNETDPESVDVLLTPSAIFHKNRTGRIDYMLNREDWVYKPEENEIDNLIYTGIYASVARFDDNSEKYYYANGQIFLKEYYQKMEKMGDKYIDSEGKEYSLSSDGDMAEIGKAVFADRFYKDNDDYYYGDESGCLTVGSTTSSESDFLIIVKEDMDNYYKNHPDKKCNRLSEKYQMMRDVENYIFQIENDDNTEC